jgi:hypothetical protein
LFPQVVPAGGDVTAPARPRRGLSVRPAVRVWTQTVVLAAAAAIIYLTSLKDLSAPQHSWVSWPLLAVAFAIAELKVVEVHFRRETHSFSLSEFPAVIGFFSLAPAEYLCGAPGAGVLLLPRQRLIKTAFNLANFMFVAGLAAVVRTCAWMASRQRLIAARRHARGHGRQLHRTAARRSSRSCPR